MLFKSNTLCYVVGVSNLALEFRKTNDIKLIVHPDGQLVPEVTFKGKMTKGIDGNTVATFHPSGKFARGTLVTQIINQFQEKFS